MKLLSLFTGAGGFDLGFEDAGFTIVEAVERDRDCVATIRLNRPNWRVSEMDIRSYDPAVEVDAITAGPPCQGYAASGPRNPADVRNALYREIVRITHKLRPRVVVVETVPGAATLKPQGRVHGFDRRIARAFRGIDYKVRIVKLDLSVHGVPQIRTRIFIIAGQDLIGDVIPTAAERSAVTAWITPRATALIRTDWKTRQRRVYPVDGPAPTIDTGGRLAWVNGQPLNLVELARLQTFPTGWRFCGSASSIKRQIGNAVPPAFAARLGAKIFAHLKNKIACTGKTDAGDSVETSETQLEIPFLLESLTISDT